MENPKIRKLLVTLHLLFAGFLTPAFLLLAITGGNYLIGNKGSLDKTPIALVENAQLDFKSATLESDVRKLLSANNIDYKFEYVKNRGTVIQLRPTSRKYIEMKQSAKGLTATWVQPSFQAGLMELHKGHGPTLFKTYQKFVALGLIGVVFGGFLVGVLARAYLRKTIIATVIGTIIFIILGFVI